MSFLNGYFSEDTIAAIASAVGGAICVIRISGPRAFEIGGKLSHKENFGIQDSGRFRRTELFSENGALLDDALTAYFVGPRSFTGEDVLELHVHGGTFLVHRIMERLIALGARQALPGEFSFRGVRNGKMSVYEAQAIADLISAQNDSAVQLALEKLTGVHSQFLSGLGKKLRELASLGELGIDFADQDIEEVSLPKLKATAQDILGKLEHLSESFDRGSKIQEGIRVVFAGLPNAGKSSFFNLLLGEARSIVSDVAGTTRDTVRETLSLRGKSANITLRLEDTAGLRNSEDPIEKEGILRTQSAIARSQLILFLVDGQSSPTDVETEWNKLQSAYPEIAKKTLGILTKTDLIAGKEKSTLANLSSLGITKWFPVSSVTSNGLKASIEGIVTYCEQWTHRETGEILLTRLDHLLATRQAIEHLKRALQNQEIELFAADLRQTLFALSPLIGETVPDDILGEIFSHFCIGK